MAEVFSYNAVAITFEDSRTNKYRSDKKAHINRAERRENAREFMKRTITKDGGRFIGFNSESYGLLVAGVEHKNKLYFLWIDKDRQIRTESMKESYKLIKEIPNNLSVLNYLYRTQRNELRSQIDTWIESNPDYTLVSDIAIKNYVPKKDNTPKRMNGKKNEKQSSNKKN